MASIRLTLNVVLLLVCCVHTSVSTVEILSASFPYDVDGSVRAPILSQYFGARVYATEARVVVLDPSDWECDSCPPTYIGNKNISGAFVVGHSMDCYVCGFEQYAFALKQRGAVGWIRFTRRIVEGDYFDVYEPGFEYRTFWLADVHSNRKDDLENFVAVVGTSKKLLDWYDRLESEEDASAIVRVAYDEILDENAFVKVWDSFPFVAVQVFFGVWSVHNVILCIWRIYRWKHENSHITVRTIPVLVLAGECFHNMLICVITFDPLFCRGFYPYEVISFFGSAFLPFSLLTTALLSVFLHRLASTSALQDPDELENPGCFLISLTILAMFELVTNMCRSFFGLLVSGPALVVQVAVVFLEMLIINSIFMYHAVGVYRNFRESSVDETNGETSDCRRFVCDCPFRHLLWVQEISTDTLRTVCTLQVTSKSLKRLGSLTWMRRSQGSQRSQSKILLLLVLKCAAFSVTMTLGFVLASVFNAAPIISVIFFCLFAFGLLSFSRAKVAFFTPKMNPNPPYVSGCLAVISPIIRCTRRVIGSHSVIDAAVAPSTDHISDVEAGILQRPTRIHGSQDRAISLACLKNFINTYVATRDDSAMLTTDDICEKIVKVVTKEREVSFTQLVKDKCCAANGAPYVGTATFFVSHSWGYKFQNLVDVCENVQAEHPNKVMYFWIDVFAINQHRISGPKLLSDLRATLQCAGKVLLVMTPWYKPRSLQRLWCLWEILQSIDLKAEIVMRFPKREKKLFHQALKHDKKSVKNALRVSSKEAQSKYDRDKYLILSQIQRTLGCRDEIEALCEALGLEVSDDAARDEGKIDDIDDEKNWLECRAENYFLKKSATGVVNGKTIRWDHVRGEIIDVENDAVLHRLDEGLENLDGILSRKLNGALHFVSSQMSLRFLSNTGDA